MPELPEVESLRQSLLPFVQGKTIKKIQILKPKLISSNSATRIESTSKSQEFIKELTKEKIQDIQRRAKNLIFIFESGKILLIHLKMTGQLVYKNHQTQVAGGHPIHNLQLPNRHTHLIFTLSEGFLYYNDIRQFGYLLYFPNQKKLESSNHFKLFGPEPLSPDFNLKKFSTSLLSKKALLKPTLLDQKVVVGLGNIYVDEVCFYAKILPNRICQSLSRPEIKLLFDGIKKILSRAIALKGSTVANYILADGSHGGYTKEHKVYGRSGKVCLVCNQTLKSIKLGGRTTVYCPNCQQ